MAMIVLTAAVRAFLTVRTDRDHLRKMTFAAFASPPVTQTPEKYLTCAVATDAVPRRVSWKVATDWGTVHVQEDILLDKRCELAWRVLDVLNYLEEECMSVRWTCK